MPINKLHDEFHSVAGKEGWQLPEGYELGAGVDTKAPFVHDYWEEVFLVSGDLTVGNDAKGEGGEPFSDYTYAVRPPGVFTGRSNRKVAASCSRSIIMIRHDIGANA